jgi:hypothetical protein
MKYLLKIVIFNFIIILFLNSNVLGQWEKYDKELTIIQNNDGGVFIEKKI